MQPGDKPAAPPDRAQYAYNLALASVAGQVGCLTTLIIIGALFAGLWLDNQFKVKPLFTVGLMLGSMPISLFIMWRVAVGAVSRIKPTQPPTTHSSPTLGKKEESQID